SSQACSTPFRSGPRSIREYSVWTASSAAQHALGGLFVHSPRKDRSAMEVEAGGMTPLGAGAAWESFDSDRFGWCMRNFDKMNEVWRAVRRYVPADNPATR